MKCKCYVPYFDWLDSAARVVAYEVLPHVKSRPMESPVY